MVLIGLVSMVLRLAELVFAAIVAGLNGEYLHEVRDFAEGRFIYTEVIAGVAIFFSLIWLIPLAGGFVHWLLEFVISIGWFVAFGLLVQYLDGSCGATFNWTNISIRGEQCGKWKAVVAFSFLSAICWLASGIVGIIWVHDRENRAYRRRTWRNRSRVY